jgi:hypothetical protein
VRRLWSRKDKLFAGPVDGAFGLIVLEELDACYSDDLCLEKNCEFWGA